MKHMIKKFGFSVRLFVNVVIISVGTLTASVALAAAPDNVVQKVRSPAYRGVPVMMLALPGRGTVLSTPGQITTIIIENEAGRSCNAYLARTDKAGVLEIPVARTAHCSSPRIVVHR